MERFLSLSKSKKKRRAGILKFHCAIVSAGKPVSRAQIFREFFT